MQSRDALDALLPFVADPTTHEPLQLELSPSGEPIALHSTQDRYPIPFGIPDFVPDSSSLAAFFGTETLSGWQKLQETAEESYATRIEGHFSTESCHSAVDYGRTVTSAPAGRYLDVGCGMLPRPTYMAGDNKTFFGVDPIATPAARDFPFARAIGELLPFADRSFDGVMFSSALDHCINPYKALDEGWRVLRPGGSLLVFESVRPDNKRYRDWVRAANKAITQFNKNHNWAFTEASLARTIASIGFEVKSLTLTSDPNVAVVVAYRPKLRRRFRRKPAARTWQYQGPLEPVPEGASAEAR